MIHKMIDDIVTTVIKKTSGVEYNLKNTEP